MWKQNQTTKKIELSFSECVRVLVSGELHISISKKKQKKQQNQNNKNQTRMLVPVYGTKL